MGDLIRIEQLVAKLVHPIADVRLRTANNLLSKLSNCYLSNINETYSIPIENSVQTIVDGINRALVTIQSEAREVEREGKNNIIEDSEFFKALLKLVLGISSIKAPVSTSSLSEVLCELSKISEVMKQRDAHSPLLQQVTFMLTYKVISD